MSTQNLIVSSLAVHMGLHVLLMNAAAPIAAAQARSVLESFRIGGCGLALATLIQIALLWAWHAPSVLERALDSALLHGIMQFSLFASAAIFWFAVLSQRNADLWRAILALLLTSKLYCLLGVLLLFAPVSLYSDVHLTHGHAATALNDQQVAGLLMLLACPPTYVLAGVIMAAKWVREMARPDHVGWVPETKSVASCKSR
jgi:putative membrane protein